MTIKYMTIRYKVVKAIRCSVGGCDPLGSSQYGILTNINQAYQCAETYNKRICGCKCEVKEIEG